jgi:hypothetical protein
MNAINRWRLSKKYKAKNNLLAKVRREIAPEIQKQIDAENSIFRQDVESQNFVFSLEKYIPETYQLGSIESQSPKEKELTNDDLALKEVSRLFPTLTGDRFFRASAENTK